MKPKVLCFHPALAPYRVDFFNHLSDRSDLLVVFLEHNVMNQKFDQTELLGRARFSYEYLTTGINFLGRCVRTGIVKRVRAYCPDVVIGYEASPTTLLLGMAKILGIVSCKVFTFVDENADQIAHRTGFRRAVRTIVLNLLDGVIVASREAGDSLRANVLRKPMPCPVIPIIHDTAEIRRNAEIVVSNGVKWRETMLAGSQEKILLFVGRLVPVKNLNWLLKAFSNFPGRDKIRLCFVGAGPDELKLRKIAETLGLSRNVRFLGHREGDELYEIMSAADSTVLCSHAETYGAVIGEAMQWGTPGLVADSCGARVIVQPGINGMVFHYNDETDFHLALTQVLRIKSGHESLLPVDLGSCADILVKDF